MEGVLIESKGGTVFDVGGIRNQVISASFVMVAQSLYRYPVVIERVVLRKVRFFLAGRESVKLANY